ncbi:hypothetical protein A3D81_02875 [Candidatus Curtissbacteria bacterium RIFCSPHIGHO2_02_FULL_40_17]|uniref:Uncharacterized protein n=4 Tax=Candidatus Curtissiibacteriota TaxID=1752717 RepID=A0A1F5GIE2_9BACT|nr:MAG: hypothetical protein A2693_02415 [Candidatus Curtissbacteria bacterium RIFCSPHIGHO2_01_FULL_40_12]OGD91651.1 MAG: hypothetical protein A3D81_02875 [Candidatus Curtissbacteria bacterium RIFCSPHIGHO2_02_FULL_40_17]OGE04527.1 MAG: hypothetical protein A3F45_03375 [Candidatus Curtissbacteria bacterium RIFCSPHIGHO2_12_FULL_41_17]OGE08090.1 MAG: hypothetical protein A3I53_00030 [Candidatus Curtissbacteria bacterium RIFCSPLOWO2_02_FULL_40_13b]
MYPPFIISTMGERVYEHRHPKSEPGEVSVTDAELVIDPGGQEHLVFDVESNCDRALEAAIDVIGEATGTALESYREFGEERRGSSQTAFSSGRWNATWEPKGPKPNWRKAPENPNLN